MYPTDMKQLSRGFLLSIAFAVCHALSLSARAADEQAEAAKKPLPSAREILDRYGKAIGGKSAFTKHSSQHAKGSVEMTAQKIKGTMEVFAARPNKMVLKVNIPGLGETTTGFDGTVAWMHNPLLGPMLLEGKQKTDISTQADFDHALHDPEHYKTMEVLGVEEFNGEECYKVKLVHRTGFASTEFFSVKTGLQLGFTATQESPLGPITATSLVNDYKKFGDLFIASRVTQRAMGMETVMTIEEMVYDNVPQTAFAMPAEVKALLEKPPEKVDDSSPATRKDAPRVPVTEPSKRPEK